MKLVKSYRLILGRKDLVFLSILVTIICLVTLLSHIFNNYILAILALGMAIIFLITIQIEIHRRNQNVLQNIQTRLTDVKERQVMDILDVIRDRRSVRRFSPQPIRDKDLRKMIDAARWAPNGSQAQPWRFIIIQDRDMLARMGKMVNAKIDELPISPSIRDGWRQSSVFFAYAPTTVAVLYRKIPELYPESDINWIIEKKGCSYNEAHDFMGRVELMSVSAAIENLLLTAHSLGYGACWMRVPYMAKDELEKMLGAEQSWELIALVPIGRAAQSPAPPPRKEIEAISTFL